MSNALIIAIAATGIAALIIAVVTWMLVVPGRSPRSLERVLPADNLPIGKATLLAERAISAEGADPCSETYTDVNALQETFEDALGQEDALAAARHAHVILRLSRDSPETVPEEARTRAEASADAVAADAMPEDPGLLGEKDWFDLLAPKGLDPALTGMMAMIAPEVITWHAFPPESYGLERQQRSESLETPPRLARLAGPLARSVGVRQPVIYVTPEREARLVHVNLALAGRYSAALAIGGDALAYQDDAVLRFMLGRKLAFMRSELILCTALDGPEDMLALQLAVTQVLRPGTLPPPPDLVAGCPADEALARLRPLFSDAEPASLMRRLLVSAGQEASVARWRSWLIAAAETSFRSGLLLAGDLRAALTILDLDEIIPGTDRTQEACYPSLYSFYLSEDYDTLRQSLRTPA